MTADLATLAAAAGLLVFLVGALFRLPLRTVIPFTLDLWTAAGLLKLAGDPAWPPIAGAASLILIRKLVTWALDFRGSRGIPWSGRVSGNTDVP